MADPHKTRRFDRAPVALAATLTLPDGTSLSGTTGTVGMGGFSVELIHVPPVGTSVSIELYCDEGPGAAPVRAEGEVVWARASWAGVAFVGTDAENCRRLRALCLTNPLAPVSDE
jgi:hypothetical protein